MRFRGFLVAPSPGAAPAPHFTVDAGIPMVLTPDLDPPSQLISAVTFLLDTGADRTCLSLLDAVRLIGLNRYHSLTSEHPHVSIVGVEYGQRSFWDVPLELRFFDEGSSLFFTATLPVLVPLFSTGILEHEHRAREHGLTTGSLLGRDITHSMKLTVDASALGSAAQVTLEA